MPAAFGKSFAWEEEGGVWRLLMCECEDEKRSTLLFEQPSSPEHRLSDLYSMALPQHSDDILKLATFQTGNGEQTVGIVRGDTVWCLQDVAKLPPGILPAQVSDMMGVIQHWDLLKNSLQLEGEGRRLSEVKIQAPIPRPTGTIMCIGKNYADHIKEVDTWKSAPGISTPEAPEHMIIFTKAPQSVIGPGAAIKYPHGWSELVDYEAELAVIIGKPGHRIRKEDALDHIFGYTILNDVTAREVQKRHQQAGQLYCLLIHLIQIIVGRGVKAHLHQEEPLTANWKCPLVSVLARVWFLGKSCDTFCPMGPWIVPASEINGQDVAIQCWINDELRQDARTSLMIFSITEMIATISAGITLQAGDILATGTPAGVGSGFNPPRHLKPGDTIRIKVEGIGELHNHVE